MKCKVSKLIFCDWFRENAKTPPAEAEGVSVILMVGLTKFNWSASNTHAAIVHTPSETLLKFTFI